MPYKIRFVNPQKQYADHREEFIKAFDETLSRGAIVNQKELREFEENFAKFVGAKYAVGVNSGTSALDVGLQALGIGRGDEVITVAHTFMASISTIILTGAKAVLVDIGEDFNIDPKKIEEAITPATKAIMPIHLNGRVCDMDAIMAIAKKHNLLIIEDAAQALGATFKMADGTIKKAGTFGEVGCFSLYWAKVLGGWGNNGITVTDDPALYEKMKLMRYNGENREDRRFYYHAHNLLMDNVHAALLAVKLPHLPAWLVRRQEIAARYTEGIKEIPQVKEPSFNDPRHTDIFTNYVIRAKQRNELKKFFDDAQSVETLISWNLATYTEPNMQNDKTLWRFGNPSAAELPETERACREVISLPCYPELTNDEVDEVARLIKEFYTKS